MHLTFKPLPLILLFSVLISSCGKEIEDPYPPSKPQWIPKSGVEEWPERGIDAEPGNVIYMEWYPNPEPDIDGYALYRKAASDTLERFDQIAYLAINDPFQPSTSYHDIDVFIDYKVELYRYFLRAKDTGGNFSTSSDTIEYGLMHPVSRWMSPSSFTDTVSNNFDFSWGFDGILTMEDYAITILDYSSKNLIVRTWFQPGSYTGAVESWSFIPQWKIYNGDSVWIDLQSGHNYQWRLDMQADYNEDKEHIGSESEWQYFTVR